MNDDLFALFEYNRWADDRVVQAVRLLTPEQYAEQPAPDCPSIRATLVHMADAPMIWARRIGGETVTQRLAEADAPLLEDAVRLLEQAHEMCGLLLPTLSPERLSTIFTYRNLRGETNSLPLWAVMRHIINHSSYHRGQITAGLMRFGVEPPLMDLALWAARQA